MGNNITSIPNTLIQTTGSTAQVGLSETGWTARTALEQAGITARTGLTETGLTARVGLEQAGMTTRTGLMEAGSTARMISQETGMTARQGIISGERVLVTASQEVGLTTRTGITEYFDTWQQGITVGGVAVIVTVLVAGGVAFYILPKWFGTVDSIAGKTADLLKTRPELVSDTGKIVSTLMGGDVVASVTKGI